MENVVYKFSLTREPVTPGEMVTGFKGILYSGYDSLKCSQQKCLIHLIRDMNKDIWKFSFDEEVKAIAQAFGVLLRAIVDTIDKFGLRKRYLGRHRRDVDRFYREVIEKDFRSERARSYQKRFRRYRDRLFVFLDHDGIPWNNNNGENAVNGFVLRRRLIGAFAETRIEEYLILLSVFQTLRYRGFSFLDFLRSGEADVDQFCAKRQGRGR
jgi:hypothetical protein